VQLAYFKQTLKNLDVYIIGKKDLKEFVTTENDVKKQKLRIPSPSVRLIHLEFVKEQNV